MKRPVALIILDGWGDSPNLEGNAVKAAHTPNFDAYSAKYPHTFIGASGRDVGLPDGQMGNSEVGHLNIGAGRVVYQPLMRITKSIEEGEIKTIKAFTDMIAYSKEMGTPLHLMGLLSDGGVHSHIEHVKGMLDMVKEAGLTEVYVHAFLDGRDTAPRSAIGYIQDLEAHMKTIGLGKIATVSGRYYAMDRDKRWERTKKAYDALVDGIGLTATTAVQAVENGYASGTDDEFVVPTVIEVGGKPLVQIQKDHVVCFFNFRPDRTRQLTRALVDETFKGFECTYFPVHFVCMSLYDVTLPNVSVAYYPESLTDTLGEYLSTQGKTQLRIAETEKYAHVTFFFNGGVEEANPGEVREMIPSPQVATYDLKPEMSAFELTDVLLKHIESDAFDLIICNFANPDMVGHTGIFEAAVKAVETVDACFGKVADALLAKGGAFMVTADHGNAETMIDLESHGTMTAHTINHVPLIMAGMGDVVLREGGKLSDLAPTLLEMMSVPQPVLMTGLSIIKK
jgi:2,3-bisphosphoglycerate-independent phosphoglycerate mutase